MPYIYKNHQGEVQGSGREEYKSSKGKEERERKGYREINGQGTGET